MARVINTGSRVAATNIRIMAVGLIMEAIVVLIAVQTIMGTIIMAAMPIIACRKVTAKAITLPGTATISVVGIQCHLNSVARTIA
jgi:hypothetical protein